MPSTTPSTTSDIEMEKRNLIYPNPAVPSPYSPSSPSYPITTITTTTTTMTTTLNRKLYLAARITSILLNTIQFVYVVVAAAGPLGRKR